MTWASEVGWITGATGTISGDIAELFVLYDGLNMSVIDLTSRVIVLEGEVLAINGVLADLPDLSGYTQLVFDVSDLQSRVVALELGFAALPDLSGYPTLLADVAQLKLDVAAIQATLEGLPDLSGYSALVAEVGSLRDDLTTLQGTVAALPDLSGYGALVSQVGDHETRIGALEAWRAVDEPEIDQLRTDVDALIAGGGGGGGGGVAVVHLKYPDDFTAVFWPSMGLVEEAEVGPAVGDTEVAVFVYGDTANAGPVFIVAKNRTVGTEYEYPVRVQNGRVADGANTRVVLTTPSARSTGPNPLTNAKAIFGSDTGFFKVFPLGGPGVEVNEAFAPVVTIHSDSLYLPQAMDNGGAGVRIGGFGRMIRKTPKGATKFRVRAAVIEGATSDAEIGSIGIRVRRMIFNTSPGNSFETACPETATSTVGPIVADGRLVQIPEDETFGFGTGWQNLTDGFPTDAPFFLEPFCIYSATPTVEATEIYILYEFGTSVVDSYRVSNYNDIY